MRPEICCGPAAYCEHTLNPSDQQLLLPQDSDFRNRKLQIYSAGERVQGSLLGGTIAMTLLAVILSAINTIMLLGIYIVIGVFWYTIRQADQTRREFDRADRIVRETDQAIRDARVSRAG